MDVVSSAAVLRAAAVTALLLHRGGLARRAPTGGPAGELSATALAQAQRGGATAMILQARSVLMTSAKRVSADLLATSC